MPAFADIRSMLYGQAFQMPWVPKRDLTGKTIIVTGSNTGIGFEVVRHLIKLKASTIIIACRNLNKGNEAKSQLLKDMSPTDNCTINVWQVDLASTTSILAFGHRVRTELPRLDIFIANAGIEIPEYHEVEGVEMMLMVNVVGAILCVVQALPKLKETSERLHVQTNITVVGSVFHIMAPGDQLDFGEGTDVFEALSDKATADMQWRYALSKLMVHQCVHELANCVSGTSKVSETPVTINVVNPGWCRTSLTRDLPEYPLPQRTALKFIGWTAEQGSRAVVHAALAGKETHGKYVSESRVKDGSQFMRSEKGKEVQKKIWEMLVARMERIDPNVSAYLS